MKQVAKVVTVLTLIFLGILVFRITDLNFKSLSLKENRSPYFAIVFLLIILAMQLIKNSIQKNRSKND